MLLGPVDHGLAVHGFDGVDQGKAGVFLLALVVTLLLLLLQHLLGVVLLGLGRLCLLGGLGLSCITCLEHVLMTQEALGQRRGHKTGLARRKRQA